MKTLWIVIGGCAGIVVLNAVGALAVDAFDFNYELLAIVSAAFYALTAFAAARSARSIFIGVLCGVAVAFTEVTLGWAVFWDIDPDVPDPGDGKVELDTASFYAIGAGAILGLLAGIAGRWAAPDPEPA
jgi:hypothetical protein